MAGRNALLLLALLVVASSSTSVRAQINVNVPPIGINIPGAPPIPGLNLSVTIPELNLTIPNVNFTVPSLPTLPDVVGAVATFTDTVCVQPCTQQTQQYYTYIPSPANCSIGCLCIAGVYTGKFTACNTSQCVKAVTDPVAGSFNINGTTYACVNSSSSTTGGKGAVAFAVRDSLVIVLALFVSMAVLMRHLF